MKRKCVSGVAALLTACPWATLAQADEADPIRIGYVAAMTGVLAPYDSVDGARCQIARINEAGGVLGRKLELKIARHEKRCGFGQRRGAGADRHGCLGADRPAQ